MREIMGEIIMEKLFVYGTLAPNRPNEHILKDIGGSWENATVKGKLKDKGWGSKMGYPGIELDKNGDDIEGFLFISKNLSLNWNILDNFEGDGYMRVITQVKLKNGELVNSYIYQLKS
jgi:gamma-glutamylcyclotransferase (GGCT)/AIG2-like uncharacterized protein YtfP